jgi:thiamine-triphosphatase
MIEVEKKFIATQKQIENLIKDAEFLNERVFTDTYYDTADFVLTTKDIWLRSREGNFELKIPLSLDLHKNFNQYEEIEEEEKIREKLNLSSDGIFVDVLQKNNFSPFCVCQTTRKKYKKDQFIIDLDVVDYQDYQYNIGEIELMVENENEVAEAVEKIMNFAQKENLEIMPVRGKVIEYLKRTKPEHYQKLVEAGVVASAQN